MGLFLAIVIFISAILTQKTASISGMLLLRLEFHDRVHRLKQSALA